MGSLIESIWRYRWLIVATVAVAAVAVGAFRRWRRSPQRWGRKGERQVRRALRRLPRRDFIALHDLMIPTGTTDEQGHQRYRQIDHVVVSTRGIFVIETKAHKGHIQGSEEAQYWQQRFLMSARSFYNPLLQNASHIRSLRRAVRGLPADMFISVVVFTEAWRIDVLTEDLVKRRRWWPARHIRRTLDPARSVKGSWWRRRKAVILDDSKVVMRLDSLVGELKRRPRILSRDEIVDIADRLQSADSKEASRRQHAASARRTAAYQEKTIRHGLCPRCGGRLILRESKTGAFFGCENFPQCRFSCPAISTQ